MPEPLREALARVRAAVLDETTLVRAVASGRRRGERPRWRRVELRYVDLRAGSHLQVTAYDGTQAHTANHPVGDPAAEAVEELLAGDPAAEAVEELLAEPFGHWNVHTTGWTHQLRVTKRGEALMRSRANPTPAAVGAARSHDRAKARLLPEDDPVLRAVGICDDRGRVKPSRQAKYRQVEEFLRALAAALDDARGSGALRAPTPEEPWRVVDLGCGNAYLTFAAHRYLTAVRGLDVELTGVDTKEQARERNAALADELGAGAALRFVSGEIETVEYAGDESPGPDVVLALHACDTATDEALARAVGWSAPVVLAAPCCHHDVAAQLRRGATPAPYAMLTRHGILRERFADTLTDALRAAVLRQVGYRVEVAEFVESKHTPRNTLLRAVRTGAEPSQRLRSEYADLVRTWGVRPRLGELLDVRG